jgi:transposase-like protein
MREYLENNIFDNLDEDEKPEFSAFSLESYIRSAAQRMIQAALEMEVSEFLQRAKYDKSNPQEFRGYRNGHHRERVVSTAVGGLTVKVPRVSDNLQKYQSKMVKPYQRRSEGLNNLFPKLFIEGLATRDFEPTLAIADGGICFWAALAEVFGQTKEQLFWLHKTRNILNQLPKREHEEAAQRLRAIYFAEDIREVERLARKLIKEWNETETTKNAAKCLESALPRLLTFFEFPTEHAKHLRTTNPIESVLTPIRLRSKPMKWFRSIKSGVHLVFILLERAKQGWRGIGHQEKLKEVKLPS